MPVSLAFLVYQCDLTVNVTYCVSIIIRSNEFVQVCFCIPLRFVGSAYFGKQTISSFDRR